VNFDFVAIDFETANINYSSACSIGLVAVKNKEIVDTKYFLIQPPTLEFDEKNISIHGIMPDNVKDAPKFPEIWNKIKHYFLNNMVVAHNAIFDMSVLRNCLEEYNLDIPDFNYLCSIPISTRACSGEGVGQSLKDRLEYFGIDLENHHNALADAEACAKLVIEVVNRKKRKSFESFCKVHSSLPIKSFIDLKPQSSLKKGGKKTFDRIVISEISATTDNFDKNHIFYNKSVVFTGELMTIDRKSAMQNVVDLGGMVKSTVSSKTDYLVVGIQDKALVGEDGMSSKERKAYELKAKGHHIQIIGEDDFLEIL